MKLAKLAVAYYVETTGNEWSKFYDNLDTAMNGKIEEQSGELWLIHSLMNVVIKNGTSIEEFKMNKDAVKALFDEEGRKKNGEFFTPVVWAEELHRYMDTHIPNWRTEMNVWENSCYSIDTQLLTKRGWLYFDELKDDDMIWTLNPSTLHGEWSGFHNSFKKKVTDKLVSILNAKVDMLVTKDHYLYVKHKYSNHNSSYDFIEADRLFNEVQSLVTDKVEYEMYTSCEKIRSGTPTSLFQFVGMFLGDGSTGRPNKVGFDCIRFTFSKDRKKKYLEKLLKELGIVYTTGTETARPNIKSYRISTSDNEDLVKFIVENFGYSTETKHIAFDILKSDDDYYGLLLGLLESDGTFESNYNYSTSSEVLAKDVDLLATYCGFTVKTGFRDRGVKGKEFRLNLRLSSTVCVRKKDFALVDYDDYVWDLTTNNDNHIFLVRRNGKCVFSKNCGSGNLIRTANITPEHLFASSLQPDDITFLKNSGELGEKAHIFQLDFLKACDDGLNNEFLHCLPDRLQEIINKDEPLVFLCNPPYKTGQANATQVGKFMNDKNGLAIYDWADFSKPSYDLFYQFCFQVMNMVAQHELKNVYYCVFGPLTWFTGAGANILLRQFEHCFEFIDGMCISAQEFSDTSESILWGIAGTVWKSRGGYINEPGVNYHKDILLDKKFITPDGTIGTEGKVLYAPPRKKLSTWVHSDDKAVPKAEFPLMTSHLTFKGGDVFEKVAHKRVKARKDLWGILMSQDTMTRSSDQSAVMSMPSSIQYEPIVKENFWRAVASYTFRRIYEADWSIAKKDISEPDINVEGYDLWLKNAIPIFLFEYKSMMSSIRGVSWEDQLALPEEVREVINIRNNFFFLTPEEVRANCTDPVILADLEANPPTEGQLFMQEVIKECEPVWAPEVRQLYDWCKTYTLATYDARKTVDYKGSLDAWDAGFQQLRAGLWNADKLDGDMTKLLVQARDFLRKDIMKYGFVSEVQSTDDI